MSSLQKGGLWKLYFITWRCIIGQSLHFVSPGQRATTLNNRKAESSWILVWRGEDDFHFRAFIGMFLFMSFHSKREFHEISSSTGSRNGDNILYNLPGSYLALQDYYNTFSLVQSAEFIWHKLGKKQCHFFSGDWKPPQTNTTRSTSIIRLHK